MCTIDFDPCDVWDVTHPKARKQHRCCECTGPIPPGTVYERVGALFDGGWDTYTTHTECEELRRFMQDVVCGGEGQILKGDLAQECHDAMVEYFTAWDDETGEEVPNPFLALLDEIRDAYIARAVAPS